MAASFFAISMHSGVSYLGGLPRLLHSRTHQAETTCTIHEMAHG